MLFNIKLKLSSCVFIIITIYRDSACAVYHAFRISLD